MMMMMLIRDHKMRLNVKIKNKKMYKIKRRNRLNRFNSI